jgi:membrane-bound lytic murein transglycosylase MltF
MLLAALAGSFWRPRAASPTGRSGLAAAE